VGQGDSFVIDIPEYGHVLVDTGENYQSNYLSARSTVFPVCSIKSVFITHYDRDHAGGLSRIKKFCRNIRIYDNFSRGDTLRFSDVYFYVLSPAHKGTTHEENDESLVLLLKKGGFSALLTGDAGLDILENLLPGLPAGVDIYKVSHHGSPHNNSFKIVDWLKPKYCVISVGENNYGHPSKDVLADLDRAGCKVYRTDKDSTVVLYYP